jgi:DNA polymerase III subunit epsilon
MKIQLDRPIVFFDLETTGKDVAKDRIVQFALLKLHPDGKEEVYKTLVNPTIPIPPEATAIHKIRNEDVAHERPFRQLADSVAAFFAGCDIGGFNSNRFDLPLLAEEMGRCGKAFPEGSVRLIDVQRIYHKKEERNLAAAYRFYCGKTLEGAHDAEADVRATLEVFLGQLERYDDIGSSVDDIVRFIGESELVDPARKLKRNERGEIVYNFGKNRDKPVTADRGYAEWMLGGDFPETTKAVVREILKKM